MIVGIVETAHATIYLHKLRAACCLNVVLSWNIIAYQRYNYRKHYQRKKTIAVIVTSYSFTKLQDSARISMY